MCYSCVQQEVKVNRNTFALLADTQHLADVHSGEM